MKKRTAAAGLLAICLTIAAPASATFHFVVVEQVFPGLEQAPHAQYVMLQTQAPLQTVVYGQPFSVYDAAGNSLGTFGTFCTTPRQGCVLPAVSPACSGGGCPEPFGSSGARILAATPWAQGLFCITADLVATGILPYPSGRVCWGDCSLRTDCGTTGPVDCVAYGSYTGDNTPFGSPAMSPMLGDALVGDPARQNQFAAHNDPLLDNSLGFAVGMPTPQNFHGDSGTIDGVAGDPVGSGLLGLDDVDAEVAVLFEADRRCTLPTARRGADANFDTRVSAADVIATLRLVTATS